MYAHCHILERLVRQAVADLRQWILSDFFASPGHPHAPHTLDTKRGCRAQFDQRVPWSEGGVADLLGVYFFAFTFGVHGK